MHNKVVKFMTFSSFRTKSLPLFVELNLLPIDFIYKLKLGILFHNITTGKIVGDYNLIPIVQMHNYNTRLSKNVNYY